MLNWDVKRGGEWDILVDTARVWSIDSVLIKKCMLDGF